MIILLPIQINMIIGDLKTETAVGCMLTMKKDSMSREMIIIHQTQGVQIMIGIITTTTAISPTPNLQKQTKIKALTMKKETTPT